MFDICHGCRRCFNLCDSFPRLFDLVDASPTQELDGVDSKDFKPVVDACTLCDMCYMTKCPYVPPHEFNLDFPHLMLRYRADGGEAGQSAIRRPQLAETDRNGKLSPGWSRRVANWAIDARQHDRRPDAAQASPICTTTPSCRNMPSRQLDRPGKAIAGGEPRTLRRSAARRCCTRPVSAITTTRMSAWRPRAVLARNGVETEVVYPRCCGMPLLEQGRIADVAANARRRGRGDGPGSTRATTSSRWCRPAR